MAKPAGAVEACREQPTVVAITSFVRDERMDLRKGIGCQTRGREVVNHGVTETSREHGEKQRKAMDVELGCAACRHAATAAWHF